MCLLVYISDIQYVLMYIYVYIYWLQLSTHEAFNAYEVELVLFHLSN